MVRDCKLTSFPRDDCSPEGWQSKNEYILLLAHSERWVGNSFCSGWLRNLWLGDLACVLLGPFSSLYRGPQKNPL